MQYFVELFDNHIFIFGLWTGVLSAELIKFIALFYEFMFDKFKNHKK